ncbi:hypothetical protein [Methylomonas koyamae]|uniref:hypothetical protein n=1 Tax=Methylomonas koyamae TaxID=702114 RepID=UPI000A6CAAF4|nr:hypothetical protein [Methylomonas koyamae]
MAGHNHGQTLAEAEAQPGLIQPRSELTLAWAALLALAGGLILNLMPCVFPVLSLKALAYSNRPNTSQARPAATAGLMRPACWPALPAWPV